MSHDFARKAGSPNGGPARGDPGTARRPVAARDQQVASGQPDGAGFTPRLADDPRLRYLGIFSEDLRREAEMEALGTAFASKLAFSVSPVVSTEAKVRSRQVPTFAEVWPQWTNGDLAKRFPDHVKAKTTSGDDLHLLVVVSRGLGDVPMADGVMTLDVVDQTMSRLEEHRQGHENDQAKLEGRKPRLLKPLDTSTRRQYAQVVRRVLQLGVYPLKLLTHNPCPRGWLPKKKKAKARGFMFPDEDRKLLACSKVPLIERFYYGLLNREGMRPDTEGLQLTDGQCDVAHEMMRLDTNKTDARREWPMAMGTPLAIRAWQHLRATPDANAHTRIFNVRDEKARIVFSDSKGRPRSRWALSKPAKQLRDALRLAGADRPSHHEKSANRIPLRAHDARATFVTLALAHGWSEDAIMRRTGHTTSGQLRNYRRDAENLREVWRRGGWAELQTSGELIGEGPTQLLPLWMAIPELREVVESGALGAAEPAPPKDPLRGTTVRKKKNKGTGGEIGRRSGFRFRRREA